MSTRISMVDVKLGIRMLFKHPALTVVGGLGLAVAVAISVGFFTVVNAYIYPKLPLDEGERIVALENRDIERNDEERRSLHDFLTWRDELTSVRDLAAFRTTTRTLQVTAGSAEQVEVAEMSAAGFRVARVPPLLGRHLVEADERAGAAPVMVIGYDVWHSRFAADPAVIGRGVRLSGTTYTVVGVMPEGFAFPMSHSFWTPLHADPAAWARREGPAIFVFGRLARDVTMEQAQSELDVIGRRTAAAFPDTHAQLRPTVMPYVHSLIDVQGITLWEVAQMQLTMTLLLFVVCLNVAVLVYARTATRHGEIAVRSALGASRARIIAQLFMEALVLSLLAAVAGLALAQAGVSLGFRILALEHDGRMPFWTDVSLGGAPVLFTVALAVLAAVIVGVLPALQATGRRLQSDLRQLGGGTGVRLGRTWTFLIVAQVALAVAALPAAISAAWDAVRDASTRPAFPAQEFLSATVAPGDDGAQPQDDSGRTDDLFARRLSDLMVRLAAEPAVSGVTYDMAVPGRGTLVEVEGTSAPGGAGFRVASRTIRPNFFDVFGTPVLAGRALTESDVGAGSDVVVVNRAFARQVLGGGEVLGKRLRYIAPDEPPDAPAAKWYRIVGVVEDLAVNHADPERVPPAVVHAADPRDAHDAFIAVRVHGDDPTELAPRLRAIVAAVDPSLQLGPIRSLADAEQQTHVVARLIGLAVALVLLSVFMLSAAGIYALMSFTVMQRRREIGIRTALGAQPAQVLRNVFTRAATQIGAGLLAGVALAVLAESATRGGLMHGRGLIILPALGLCMAAVGFLAALGPARRGLRLDPTEALRADT